MKRTIDKMSEMTREKQNSKKTADRLVMDELLEMGFSYNSIGTHYLHDSIVYSLSARLENFKSVNAFCQYVGGLVQKKYNVGIYQYSTNIECSIERAFDVGNINYILDIFKNSYDKEKMKVTKNVFIMTVRNRIMEAQKKQNFYNASQLRIIIQGELENIIDMPILESMYNIVVSLKEGVRA